MTIHYGHFDNSGNKKYAILHHEELLKYENQWGRLQIRTFTTKEGAIKFIREH